MSTKLMYSLHKNIYSPVEDRRSFSIHHGTKGVNISVGTQKEAGILNAGESNHTITLNKTQVALVIGVLTEIHAMLEES